jgi:hypothetical protein
MSRASLFGDGAVVRRVPGPVEPSPVRIGPVSVGLLGQPGRPRLGLGSHRPVELRRLAAAVLVAAA